MAAMITDTNVTKKVYHKLGFDKIYILVKSQELEISYCERHMLLEKEGETRFDLSTHTHTLILQKIKKKRINLSGSPKKHTKPRPVYIEKCLFTFI